MERLSTQASSRVATAFRPKTRKAYTMLFKVFIAFCLLMKVSLSNLSVKVLIAFFECLVANKCSVAMVSNYASAIKANFIVYDLPFHICDHPKIKYFIKSLKINRPLSVTSHNIVDIPMLSRMCDLALNVPGGKIFKATILTGFFRFLRLSNLCPHSLGSFDPSRHLTGGDVAFTKDYVKLPIKWSKTMQTRDYVHILTLPCIPNKNLCPRTAIKELRSLYSFDSTSMERVGRVGPSY